MLHFRHTQTLLYLHIVFYRHNRPTSVYPMKCVMLMKDNYKVMLTKYHCYMVKIMFQYLRIF